MRREREPGRDTHGQNGDWESALPGPAIKKERSKGNTRQHMHSADPKDCGQALRIFCSRTPLSLTFQLSLFLFTPGSAPPPPREFLPSMGALSSSSPKALPGTVAAFPCTHLPLLVAVPLLAGGSDPNDANCTLVKGGGELRGRAGGRTRGL